MMNNIQPVQRLWLKAVSLLFSWKSSLSALWQRIAELRLHRVTVMLQLSAFECGAACLAMILNYYGRKTHISECREACGVGRDGVAARTIAKVARTYGLRVRAFSVEPAAFEYMPLPAIIHWNFNHFVIVERWSPTKVDIIDPGTGRRRLNANEFDAGFTGLTLTFEPGLQFKPCQEASQAIWRKYIRYILRTPGVPAVLLQVLGLSLLLQVFGLSMPVFTKVLIDKVLPFAITNMMTLLGIGMAIMVGALVVTGYLRSALMIYIEARLDSHMMLGFFEHVLSLPFTFFQQRSTGDLLMRLASNTMVREILTNQTVSVVLDVSLVLVYLAVLLIVNPAFGVIVFVIGMLQIMLLLSTAPRIQALLQRDLCAQAESQSYLVEAMTGVATLKASGAEDRVLDHWSNLFFNQLNISMKRSQLSAIIDTAMMGLRIFSSFLLLWIGAFYVLEGGMRLGTMLALNTLAASFLAPLTSLVSCGQQLQLVKAHLERLADVIEAEPEQSAERTIPAPQLSGRIELQHVNFRYSPQTPLALRDITLIIEPGQKIALVGRTGSGKSTLAKLLLGLYAPAEGEILYDDIPLSAMNFRTVRSQFGAVLQESFLFSGSIRQNIAFNDPSISLDQVMDAARMAQIHDEVSQMPMGYESLVAEGGVSLSGGQRQRLSIARALAHTPAVVLLDEATSHLDAITERLVDENLSNLRNTRIVIAHRLSTIRNADLILVLDEGMIVERGSHEELMAKNGHYAALVDSQLEKEFMDITQKINCNIIDSGCRL